MPNTVMTKQKATPCQIVMIVVFCAILSLAFPVFNLFSKQLSMDNHENRLLTGLPTVLSGPPSELLKNLDAFFVDNSPFRYQLVVADASIDYTLFGTSQSDQVIPGAHKNGWLFYKDGPAAAPLTSYQGLAAAYDTPEALQTAAAQLQRLSDTLAANGCALYLDLTPKKDRIYREYLPAGYPMVNEQNRTDLFAAAMREGSTVPVMYSGEAMRAAALNNPERLLYFKADTHWNHAGALLSLDAILSAAGLETPDFDSYTFAETDIHTGDMANVAALYKVLPDEHDVYPTGYDGSFTPDSRTVGVIGDSFSEYYMPYLSQRFTESWRQTLDTLTPALAADPGCDILILEANERSVDPLLALLAQF